MNRQDPEGNDLFGGGFLGLDNISPFDRSHPPDFGGKLIEADGTTWMAAYCLGLLAMAGALAQYNTGFQDVAVKFFEHFWRIAAAINDQGVWDETDGWYYDVIERPDGSRMPVRARSIVGVLPVMAAVAIRSNVINELPELAERARAFVERFTADADARAASTSPSSAPSVPPAAG